MYELWSRSPDSWRSEVNWYFGNCLRVAGKSYVTPAWSIINAHTVVWDAPDLGVTSDFQGEWECGDIPGFKITLFKVDAASWYLTGLDTVWNGGHLPRQQERASGACWSLCLGKLSYWTCLIPTALSEGDPTNSPDRALCFIVLILELFATWIMMFFCDCSVFLHKEVLHVSTLRWHVSVAEMDCNSGNTRILTCHYCRNSYKSFKKQHLSWEKPFQCCVTKCIIILSHVTKGNMAFLFSHGPQMTSSSPELF